MRDKWHDMAQTVRHLAVLTNFVPLKWHDLARHIAWQCGNKIHASVRLALVAAFSILTRSSYMCFAFCSKLRHYVAVRSVIGLDSRASSDMSNGVSHLYGKPCSVSFWSCDDWQRSMFYCITSFTARRVCIARTMPWQDVSLSVRPSVCPSHAGIV